MPDNAAEWNGRRLGDTVALAVCGDVHDSLVVGAATDETSVVLRPDQIGRFLRVHAHGHLVCHNAGQVHWAIHDQLESENDSAGQKALWGFSKKSRLHDVMLLDQRLHLALGMVYSLPEPIERLVSAYRGASDAAASASRQRGTKKQGAALSGKGRVPAGEIAADTLAVYGVLRQKTDGLIRVAGVPRKWVQKFGPLGLGIDVQGAIALALPSRHGLTIHPQSADELYHAAEDLFRRSSVRLRDDKWARPCFQWDGESVARDHKGFPKVKSKALRMWLGRMFDRFRDVHGGRMVPPLDGTGQISMTPEHWGILLRCDPLLTAWGNMLAAAGMSRWLQPRNDWLARPTFGVVPEIRSFKPDLATLREFGKGIFRPRPGCVFLVGRLTDLELRSFATVCERRYHQPDVYIAHMFRDGDDPMLHTAARLFAMEAGLEEVSPEAFQELATNASETYRYWRAVARTLLFAVPRGLADPQIRELLRSEVPGCDVGEADACRLWSRLVREYYRELVVFLEDTTVKTLAKRLGADPMKVEELRLAEAADTWEAALRNVLSGKRTGTDVWRRLQSLAESGPARRVVEKGEGGPEAYALLLDWPVTFSGRVGRPGYGIQVRSAEYLDVADEVRKTVAYELAAAGFRLLGIAGDEFAVEVPEVRAGEAKSLESMANAAAGRILGEVANGCCVCRTESQW